jgi:hypothetical protein
MCGDRKMKRSRVLTLCVAQAFVILLALNSGVVFSEELKGEIQGSFNALDSGYAITRWPWDGGELFPGESATVRAGATEPPTPPPASHVVFRWNRPNGSHFDTPAKPLTKSDDTWNGRAIWDAYDTQTLDMDGDWGVQALFLDSQGKLQGPNPYPIVKIKAISWHVVPEVPLGTVAIMLSMLGAFGIFAIAKRKKFIPRFKFP